MASRFVDRSVPLMINHRTRLAALAIAVTVAVALPASAQAKTQTIRVFDRTDQLVLTQADGTVVSHPPFPEAQAGDRLDVYSSVFAGNHSHHAKRATGSTHVVCMFSGAPEPDCISHVAFGGSMLIFADEPGTVIAGTGRYLHASGRVISNKEVSGGSDVVAKIRF
jgi:hypothetical protein